VSSRRANGSENLDPRHDGRVTGLVDQVASALRARGERMTGPRRAVIEVLAATPGHLTAEQVVEALAGTTVHRASVYRSLEALSDLGVVQHVHLGHGATSYHLADQHGPHLHAQCRTCGTVLDLPPTLLDTAARRLLRDTGFRLDAAHVALSGRCATCTDAPDED
jgi:Fur family ferric uptake transcriptional regulator